MRRRSKSEVNASCVFLCLPCNAQRLGLLEKRLRRGFFLISILLFALVVSFISIFSPHLTARITHYGDIVSVRPLTSHLPLPRLRYNSRNTYKYAKNQLHVYPCARPHDGSTMTIQVSRAGSAH